MFGLFSIRSQRFVSRKISVKFSKIFVCAAVSRLSTYYICKIDKIAKHWLFNDRKIDTPWLPVRLRNRSTTGTISTTIQIRSKRIVIAVGGSSSMHFEVSTSTLYSDQYCYSLLPLLSLLLLLLFNSFLNLETCTRCLPEIK